LTHKEFMLQIAEELLGHYSFLPKRKITILIDKFFQKQKNSQICKQCKITKRTAYFCRKCNKAVCFKCQFNHAEIHNFDYFL